MRFLLDTDTCVFWLRGRAAVHARLAAVGPEALSISAVTLAELRYGADCSVQPDANHRAIDDFISGIAVLAVDADVARAFGEIKAQLRRQGNLIEDFDLLLAATALINGLTLVINNATHFGRVAGLLLDNWMQT
jgi:tRNA(fMet)-specific endonuclease VapC